MQEQFQNLSDLEVAGICACFGGLCGMLSHLLKVQEGKPFLWSELLLHTAISAICGLCAYEVLAWYGVPPPVAGALCGMAGWMGTRFIRIVEIKLHSHMGVSPSEHINGEKE